ncbi:MAG: hypothetical protein WC919_07630 [Candidatus Paceibacterota bacterium]|jgi:hypothetical protein
MKMHLGIVWKNGQIINHRSLLKVLCNPLLRCFGWQIASLFNEDKFIRYTMMPTCRTWPIKWSFRYDADNCVIDSQRAII